MASAGGAIYVPALDMTIPAYFLVGAIGYAIVMSGISSIVGWPLIRAIETKNHREGIRFAGWRASANRVGDFITAMHVVSDDHIATGATAPPLMTIAALSMRDTEPPAVAAQPVPSASV